MKKTHLLAILALVAPVLLFSQGTISGTIIDEEYSEPLIGANVVIEGTAIGTSTDFDGKYQFEAEPGTYTIVVTYIGYAEKRIEEVEVKDGEITYLDVALGDNAQQLDLDVTVTAKVIERSENALLLLQKKSDKIQDGISAQEMSRFSVSNAAGALKKVTGATVSGGKYIYIRGLGDRYSLSQLNGLIIPSTDPYRNSAQLDLIPSNLLENIITAKTFTPDQPGTFTGGNVNIKTKSFPEQMTLTVSLSSSFNSQNNLIDNYLNHNIGGNDYFGYGDGSRNRPAILDDPEVSDILNVRAPLSARFGDAEVAQNADRAIRAMNQEFVPVEDNSPLDHGISVAFGNQYTVFGKQLGLILSGSFKNSYRHLPGFQRANWILEDVSTGVLRNQGDFAETVSVTNPQVSGLAGLAYKFNELNSVNFNFIYNHNTSKTSRFIFGERPDNIIDEERLEGRSLAFNERELTNFQLGGTHVIQKEGAERAAVEIEWKASIANSTMTEPDSRFFENQVNIADDPNTFSIPASNIQRPFHFYRDLDDEQLDLKLDITIPFTKVKANKLKFGTLITQKERDFSEFRYQIEENFSSELRQFDGDVDAYLAEDNLGIIAVDDDSTSFTLGNYLVNRTEARNNYTGSDDVTSFYGMITYQLTPRLKFVGGARVERTELFVESLDTTRAAGQIDTTDILPSVNLIYGLNEDMNLRASFSQTVARPNMREIAPFESFDPLTLEIYLGNPEINRTKILNLDLRWEWFINPGELLAVSAYYKSFDDPITLFYRRAPSPEIQFTNVDKAELYGVEFEFRKDLASLGSFFTNLKLNTNLSFIESSADVINVTELEPDDRPFEGQPTYILNAALIYEDVDRGIDAVLSLNAIGDRLNIIGREGTPDIFDRGRAQLDFNFIKNFGNFDVKFSAKNLTDNRFLVSSEYEGVEYVYQRFQRGITLGLGLSYRIR